jgi:outer membrane protein assembly factor BamA
VLFIIRDYPSVVERVEYHGAKTIKRDDLDQITNIRTGTPLDPIANRAACQRIMAKYKEEGRPFATCELVEGGDPNDTAVVFAIDERPIIWVTRFGFTGNTFLSSKRLLTYLDASRWSILLELCGIPYNSAQFDHDANELTKVYRSFCFHDVRVTWRLQRSRDLRYWTIVYTIQEGVRSRVHLVYPPDKPGTVQVQYEVEERPGKPGPIIIGTERTGPGTEFRRFQEVREGGGDASPPSKQP